MKSKTHKEYLGDLIGGSLMLKEAQAIAELLLSSPSAAEWNDAIINKNVLQKRSEASAKRNAATLKKRLSGLSSEILEQIAFGGAELAAQLMFAATLINSPLLTDFMKHRVMDARRIYRESLDVSDWEGFWSDCCRLYPEFESMSETSTYKISQVAFKLLADAGYLNSTKDKALQNVFILPETRQLISAINRDDVLSAMED